MFAANKVNQQTFEGLKDGLLYLFTGFVEKAASWVNPEGAFAADAFHPTLAQLRDLCHQGFANSRRARVFGLVEIA